MTQSKIKEHCLLNTYKCSNQYPKVIGKYFNMGKNQRSILLKNILLVVIVVVAFVAVVVHVCMPACVCIHSVMQ